jgi:3-deoxy-manno-octulosonate cytidylyltransferase (CMP-KDO synthetase)
VKALLIIPARWNSSRFPGKPLHRIAGQALLHRVWQRCRRARDVDRTLIATDDRRIAEEAAAWGAEAIMTSHRHLSGTDRIAEVAAHERSFDLIINVQGDEPLIDPRLIDRLIGTMRSDRQLQMITAAHPFEKASDAVSPHQVKVVTDLKNDALYFSRSPIPFPREKNVNQKMLRHQGIYGFRRKLLLQFVRWKPTPLERAESLEQLRALEHGVRVHVLVTKHGSPGIDTPSDAAALEQILLRKLPSSRAKLRDPGAKRAAHLTRSRP